jgi:hypothetical protein
MLASDRTDSSTTQHPGGAVRTARVRLATAEDDGRLLAFLERYWRTGHVFVRQPELYRWQHSAPDAPAARNFTLGLDEQTDDLLAVQGFIPLRRFDPQLPCHDCFLAIWKTRDDAGVPGLGVRLYQFLLDEIRPDLVAVIGLSRMVIPLYRALRFRVGLFDHHAFFNRAASRYSIAEGVPPLPPLLPAVSTHELHTATREVDVPAAVATAVHHWGQAQRPQKSWRYVVQRYLRHPVYDYRLSWLTRGGAPVSAFVWRSTAVDSASVLRLVDVLGDTSHWRQCEGHFQSLLEAENAEYLDLYHHGLLPADLEAAGFVNRRTTPGLVVPNYFQPFVRQNVELDYGYRFYGPASGPVRLFRGDADQDRPNEPGPFRPMVDPTPA